MKYAISENYVDREHPARLLNELAFQIINDNSCRHILVYGLSGVGKTQLCLDFYETHKEL